MQVFASIYTPKTYNKRTKVEHINSFGSATSIFGMTTYWLGIDGSFSYIHRIGFSKANVQI